MPILRSSEPASRILARSSACKGFDGRLKKLGTREAQKDGFATRGSLDPSAYERPAAAVNLRRGVYCLAHCAHTLSGTRNALDGAMEY